MKIIMYPTNPNPKYKHHRKLIFGKPYLISILNKNGCIAYDLNNNYIGSYDLKLFTTQENWRELQINKIIQDSNK